MFKNHLPQLYLMSEFRLNDEVFKSIFKYTFYILYLHVYMYIA